MNCQLQHVHLEPINSEMDAYNASAQREMQVLAILALELIKGNASFAKKDIILKKVNVMLVPTAAYNVVLQIFVIPVSQECSKINRLIMVL